MQLPRRCCYVPLNRTFVGGPSVSLGEAARAAVGGGVGRSEAFFRRRGADRMIRAQATLQDAGAEEAPTARASGLAEASVHRRVLHWLHTDEVPRLIVDSTAAIEWLNLSAELELERGRDILKRGGQLMAVNPVHQARLLAVLASEGGEVVTLCLRSDEGTDHLLVSVKPLPEARFGIQLRRGGAFRPAYSDLQSVFQLTRGENRILLYLADGHTASQVAQRLCVSTGTVRTHIKNIYAKLNVSSREGLLSRIRAYQM